MNVKQLERIRKMVRDIRAEYNTDFSGLSAELGEAIMTLSDVVTDRLKTEVWLEYIQGLQGGEK